MNLSIFSFSFILFLHFSKVGILKFEILKYKRTKLSSIIQANIIKYCYFNEEIMEIMDTDFTKSCKD